MKVTFFQCPSPGGQELAREVEQALGARPLRGLPIELRVQEHGTQFDITQACLRDDVVIFDGSVEDEIGANYKAANSYPMTMDHVLVVSRTRLPLNFHGLREGGAPDLADPQAHLPNHELVRWILKQLDDLEPHLPRPADDRLDIPSFDVVVRFRGPMHMVSERIMRRSIELQEQRRRSQVFVSYRSRYSRFHPAAALLPGEKVEDMIEYIKVLRGDPTLPVKYYPPGTLTSDFMMTEHRCWQIVSMVDRYIRAADELWIFETADYHDSWWTQSELVTLDYIRTGSPSLLPRVFRYQPGRGEPGPRHREAPELVPSLPADLRKEMARFFTNADPGTAGPESAKAMMTLKRLPKPLRWLIFKGSGWLQKAMFPPGSEMAQTWDQITFEDACQSLGSHAYDEGFWEDRIVTCPRCVSLDPGRARFDAEAFIYSRGPGMHRVTPAELAVTLDRGRWSCPTCRTPFRVLQKPHFQFFWWPVRVGQATGPGGVYVEKIPTYQIEPLAA